jgi:DNA modification methylase
MIVFSFIQEPIDILMDFIKRSTKVGEVVLDPYAGSFSTAKASKQTNRQSISFEIDSEYCKIGKKYLKKIK